MRLKKSPVVFDEFTHTYEYDGRLLMGVTTLMKKHGLTPAEYKFIPKEKLEAAAERGSAIHALLEDYDNGKPVVEDENLKAYKALGLDIVRSEYLVSDHDIVASKIDKVFADCSLGDVKTTSSIHTESVSWQLSIYAYLFEAMNPSKKVPHLYCIHVRDGKARLVEVKRIPSEVIEDLLRAEKEGRIYEAVKEERSALEAVSEDGLSMTVRYLGQIAEAEAFVKELKAKVAECMDAICAHMERESLTELTCPAGKFSFKAAYKRSSVDSAKLKSEHPDIYNSCLKETTVKASVTFKAN